MSIGGFFRKIGHGIKKVPGVVERAAPTIAAVVSVAAPEAAPFVGAAASILSSKLNNPVESTSEAVTQAITQAAASPDPAQMQAVTAADQQMAGQMKALNISSPDEFVQMFMADRADARDMQEKTGSIMPAMLAIWINILVGSTLGCLIYMMVKGFHDINPEIKDLTIFLLGNLTAAWKDVYGYYFGSSAGSDAKNQMLSNALQNGK